MVLKDRIVEDGDGFEFKRSLEQGSHGLSRAYESPFLI